MPYQQSILGREISVVVLQARTTNLDDLLTLVSDVLVALEVLKAG
jgi:hypothetical protein